jgi:hypothetical protein
MSVARDPFVQETIQRLLNAMPMEERLEGISVAQRIQGLSLDEIVAALSPEMRKALVEQLEELDAAPDLVVENSRSSNRE